MNKVPPTLRELANPNKFKSILDSIIQQSLGKPSNKEASYELPHGVYDRSWEAGGHLVQLSTELARRIEEAVTRLSVGKFNKLDPQKTRLLADKINLEDVWVEVNKWFEEKIERQLHQEKTEIPGFARAVNEGVILTVPGKKVPETTLEDRENARAKFVTRLPRIDDEITLLTKFRNQLFEYLKQEYGIFKESSGEINTEQRINRK